MSKEIKKEEPIANEAKPTLYLSKKDLPEIESWDVGDSYKLLLEVKQTSKSTSKYDNEESINATFEVTNIRSVDGNESSKDFKEFEKSYDSKRSK